MLLKAMAVVRTLFLVFVVGYTVRGMPFWNHVPKTFDEQYAVCAENLALLSRAAWIAIGWIAFETLVGWWMATRDGRKKLDAAAGAPPPSTGSPPFAPPR
jgi:heme A synthase